MTILAQHATAPAPLLVSVAPDAPPPLADVIDRCLAKDPAARVPSGEALADAIALALQPAVAVRAFVTQSKHLAATARLYLALASLALPLLGRRAWTAPAGWAQAAPLAIGAALAALPVAVLLARVRRLLVAGFGRRDLTAVLQAGLERRREELAFLYGEGPSRLERALRGLCYVALTVTTGALVATAHAPWLLERPDFPILLSVAATTALLAAVTARGRTARRTDPAAERRLRFWSGLAGRWVFALAGLGRRRRPELAPGGGGGIALTPAGSTP